MTRLGPLVPRVKQITLVIIATLFAIVALALPTLVGGGDWNGIIQGTFTLLLWGVLSFCIFRLRPAHGSYSVKAVFVALLLSMLSYEALQATNIYWAKPLGATDDDIERSIENLRCARRVV